LLVAKIHQHKWKIVTSAVVDDIDAHDELASMDSNETEEMIDVMPVVDFETLLHDNTDPIKRTIDPTVFMAGLIKTIWIEVGNLWKHHLQTVHKHEQKTRSPSDYTGRNEAPRSGPSFITDQSSSSPRTPILSF
jgi:hypothetical protein